MWRWLHSLPRAIRNQFHPPGASAGVCVEDENRLRNTSSDIKEVQSRLRYKESYQRYQKRRQRCKHSNFWWALYGPNNCIDTLKCGPVVTAGLQSGHAKATHGSDTDASLAKGKNQCLYYRLVSSLPSWDDLTGSLSKNLFPADKAGSRIEDSKKQETKQTRVEVESLESAFINFEKVCQRYTAVGKGIMGSQAAHAGHMTDAVHLWRESSDLGHGKSQFNLAVCYETGQGVKKDMGKAVYYYTQAVKDDHALAMYNLALLYMEGNRHVTEDKARAHTLMIQAADLGLPQAQKYLGVYYSEEEQDTSKALHYLIKAAEQNDGEAQYLLALCYESGYGVEENQCKAAHWYTQSASVGYPEAMFSLAVFHQNGYGGLPVSQPTARALYQKAADLGHDESKEELQKLDMGTLSNHSEQNESVEREEHDVGLMLKINSCVSAPCLTDLVREDISPVGSLVQYGPISYLGTLSQIYSQLMVPRALTELPSLKEIYKRKGSISDEGSEGGSDSGVVFKLGSDGEEEEEGAGSVSSSPRLLSSWAHSHEDGQQQEGLTRKHATMPDLLLVPND